MVQTKRIPLRMFRSTSSLFSGRFASCFSNDRLVFSSNEEWRLCDRGLSTSPTRGMVDVAGVLFSAIYTDTDSKTKSVRSNTKTSVSVSILIEIESWRIHMMVSKKIRD